MGKSLGPGQRFKTLLKAYTTMVVDDDYLEASEKPVIFKPLLFSLCLFHGILLERKKYGSLGFNIPYEFTDGDLRICQSQLRMFLDEYNQVIRFPVRRYWTFSIVFANFS